MWAREGAAWLHPGAAWGRLRESGALRRAGVTPAADGARRGGQVFWVGSSPPGGLE